MRISALFTFLLASSALACSSSGDDTKLDGVTFDAVAALACVPESRSPIYMLNKDGSYYHGGSLVPQTCP